MSRSSRTSGAFAISDQSHPPPSDTAGAPAAPVWRRWAWAAATVAAWQLAWNVDMLPPIGLPSPLEIALALWQLAASGELWFHLEATLPRLGFGWICGALVGVLAAWGGERWTAVRSLLAAAGAFAAAVPVIALLPLFMIWMGAGETATIAAVALAAVVPAGHEMSKRGDARGVAASFRTSLPAAMATVVAIEMIRGGFGLGALVYSAAELYRSDQIIAGCLVLAAIMTVLRIVLQVAERGAGGRA